MFEVVIKAFGMLVFLGYRLDNVEGVMAFDFPYCRDMRFRRGKRLTFFWGELLGLLVCPRDRKREGDSTDPIGGIGKNLVNE